MAGRSLVLWIIVLTFSINSFAEAEEAAKLAKNSSCKDRCGSVRIPYPFGMGTDRCYVDDWFEIICKRNSTLGSTPKPFLRRFNQEVLEISIPESTIRVSYRITASCSATTTTTTVNHYNMEFENSPFAFSESNNIFVAMGCNNSASMWSPDGRIIFGGCKSPCDHTGRFIHKSRTCNGKASNCCQTQIPYDLNAFITTTEPKVSHNINANVNGEYCNYAFLAEKHWFQKYFTVPNPNMSVPVVLKWGIDPTTFSSKLLHGATRKQYRCHRNDPTNLLGDHNFTISTHTCACAPGYKGNPYLPQGCQDIDECANPDQLNNHCSNSHREDTDRGHRCTDTRILLMIIGISTILGALFLVIGGWCSYKVVQKRRRMKFFKRNGGLLLQQQLSIREANVENIKLFSSKDLEVATNYFNVNRILGQGGQGIVYKGILADGRIVAIKKSKVMDEEKLQEFINEVVILSRVNHKNVVKLLGCCLETEVPLLVYEFIPNGTLSQYLNDQNDQEFPLTWDTRLQIAKEVAGALFYLHSAASSPIYHRDIKSINILLDEKLKAKVADFGISRFVAIDQTHISTLVQGTFGYIDPEYYESGQFTEKSDVYSFGVVLAEILTREKPISSTRTSKAKSLASYFITSMEENNLFGILDNQVLKEAKKEEIIKVANLVERCLQMEGKKRPTMKEVAMELEVVQILRKRLQSCAKL